MMKKRIPFIVATMSMLLAFSACDAHAHKDLEPTKSGSYSPVENLGLSSFNIKEANVSMVKGETYQLGRVIKPDLANIPSISYTSSNPSAVSVDANGKLTAKECGFAIITANCGGFSSQSYVSVTLADSFDQGHDNIKTIMNHQASSSYEIPSYLDISEVNVSTIKKDGVVQNSSTNYEKMVISTEEAYIYITDSYWGKTKVQGGNVEFSSGTWVIYCTDEFETFLFHIDHEVKRYIKVDCTAYVEQDDRWAAVAHVLDLLFSSGSKIFTNQIETVSSSEETAGIEECLRVSDPVITYKDARGDNSGNAWAKYTLNWEDNLIDFDLGNNLGIPSGVYADINRTEDFYYTEDYCRYMNSRQIMTYDWRGSTYVDDSITSKSFDIEPKELYYPDIKGEGWTEGEDIFDI